MSAYSHTNQPPGWACKRNPAGHGGPCALERTQGSIRPPRTITYGRTHADPDTGALRTEHVSVNFDEQGTVLVYEELFTKMLQDLGFDQMETTP